jgi:hypothetical protein
VLIPVVVVGIHENWQLIALCSSLSESIQLHDG